MRTTKAEVNTMFKRLLKALGKEQGPIMLLDNRDNVNHISGGYILDYAPIYGGYVIEEECENGGISHPFGSPRRSAREMYLSMLMTAQALENVKHELTLLNKKES